MSGDKHCRGRLGEEAKEGMNNERLILLNLGSNAQRKCGLRQGNGDASVGDVASGTKQPFLGQRGQPQRLPRTTLANSELPNSATSMAEVSVVSSITSGTGSGRGDAKGKGGGRVIGNAR